MVILLALIAFSMGITILRGIIGPTRYDRFLVMNSVGTQLTLLIVLFAVFSDDMMLIDIALVYALINSVTTVAFLNYVRGSDVSPKSKKKAAK